MEDRQRPLPALGCTQKGLPSGRCAVAGHAWPKPAPPPILEGGGGLFEQLQCLLDPVPLTVVQFEQLPGEARPPQKPRRELVYLLGLAVRPVQDDPYQAPLAGQQPVDVGCDHRELRALEGVGKRAQVRHFHERRFEAVPT